MSRIWLVIYAADAFAAFLSPADLLYPSEGLEASGQSCRAYAKQIGVNAQTLAGWRWKLRQRASAGAPA